MNRWKRQVNIRELGVPTRQQLEEELEKERKKNDYERLLRNTVYFLVVVAAAVVLIAVRLLPVVQIDGSSMTPTLRNGDVVAAVRGSRYQRGDVIAFYHDNQILVKRIIALEGDLVEMDGDGSIYVNGDLLEESYLEEKDPGNCDIEMPYRVPEGGFFVLGDHRKVSVDSRSQSVGCVKEEQIAGKILIRIWPLQNISFIK